MSAPLRPLGMAVVGLGRIAGSHLQAIAAQPEVGRVIAVVDPNLGHARQVAERYGAAHAVDDVSHVLALDEVDAVCLCTPNALHEEQTLLALAAGRHVLVEKPMAESLAGATRMAAAADRTGLVLAVGHTFRHGAAVRFIQDHRGDYGRLRAVQISMCYHWDGPQAPWWKERTAASGLILSLLAPHALDFLQDVMGADEPLRVTVEAARHQSGWQAEDEAMILLRYPQDRMAFIHLSYNQPCVLDRKTLHFERALLRVEDGDSLWIDDRLVIAGDSAAEDGMQRMGGRDLGHYFRTQFAEFALAVRGREHRSVLHPDALRITALLQRILLAANSHS